jgi:hypothetical protein
MGLVLDYKNGIPSLETRTIHAMEDAKESHVTNIIQLYNKKTKEIYSLDENIPGNYFFNQ